MPALEVAYDPGFTDSQTFLEIECTPVLSKGITGIPFKRFRVLGTTGLDAISPADILDAFELTFGALRPGRIWLRFTPCHIDGSRGRPTIASCAVT